MIRMIEEEKKFDPTDNFEGKQAKPFPNDKDGDGRINEAVILSQKEVAIIRDQILDDDPDRKTSFDMGVSLATHILVAARNSDNYSSVLAQRDLVRGMLSVLK